MKYNDKRCRIAFIRTGDGFYSLNFARKNSMVMEIIIIEKQAFERMKQAFENFACRIKELCESRQNKSEWLNNEEVCDLLHISKRTLQTYRDTGTIPYSKIGRKCYYKTSDVEQFINPSQKQK
jgi:excisionase family DNA binding protein